MAVNHMVRRGDSLSALAGRYLGNPNKWREIYDFHNEQVKLRGFGNKALFAIKNADLIYVGQVLVIPGRGERLKAKPVPVAAVGNPAKPATPVDLKTTYYIGPPKHPSPTPTPPATPAPCAGTKITGGGGFALPLDLKSENTVFQPIRYGPRVTPDFTMISEMSGEITLENLSPDRHRSNWELAITDDQNALSHKLRQAHGKAFLELTSGMGMAFDPKTKRAILRPSIAAKAGLGPYEFEVNADGPNHLSSTMKLEALSGQLEQQGRVFKFTASVVIKVDVTLHPAPKGGPATNEVTSPRENVAYLEKHSNQTIEEGNNVGIIGTIVVVILFMFAGRGMIVQTGKTMTPAMQRFQYNPAFGMSYMHIIDPYRIPDA